MMADIMPTINEDRMSSFGSEEGGDEEDEKV